MKRFLQWLAVGLMLLVAQSGYAAEYQTTLPCTPIAQWIAQSAARTFIICPTTNGFGHLVDLRSGDTLLATRFEEIASSMIAFSYSADGSTMAFIAVDGTAVLYSVAAPPRTVPAGPPGQGISFVSGSRLLVTNLQVWDPSAEPKLVATVGGEFAGIRDAALVPGRFAATAGEDTTIRIYDAGTWQALREIRSSYNTPTAVAFSLDGQQLFVGGVDRLVRRYDAQTGVQVASFKAAGLVTDLLVLPDGKSIAVQTQAMMAVPPATWEIIDIESGTSRPCAQERTAHGLAVIDAEIWCFGVQGQIVDAWTLEGSPGDADKIL